MNIGPKQSMNILYMFPLRSARRGGDEAQTGLHRSGAGAHRVLPGVIGRHGRLDKNGGGEAFKGTLHLVHLLVELGDGCLRLHVHLIIQGRRQRVLSGLPVLAHHDHRGLQGGDHGHPEARVGLLRDMWKSLKDCHRPLVFAGYR